MKHIIFDFGNVLLDIDINKTVEAFKNLGITKLNPLHIHPQNTGIFLAFETGDIEPQDFFTKINEMAEKPLTEEQITVAWNELLLPYDFKRFEMVTELRKSGYKCHLLSNTNIVHHISFEKIFDETNPWNKTFKEMFDSVYYSDQMQLRKPNREIYQQVQNDLACEGADILFIDDNAPNLVEPQALGWQTYHLTKPETIIEAMKKLTHDER